MGDNPITAILLMPSIAPMQYLLLVAVPEMARPALHKLPTPA